MNLYEMFREKLQLDAHMSKFGFTTKIQVFVKYKGKPYQTYCNSAYEFNHLIWDNFKKPLSDNVYGALLDHDFTPHCLELDIHDRVNYEPIHGYGFNDDTLQACTKLIFVKNLE